jgi:plasmid stabilization system protein ParE
VDLIVRPTAAADVEEAFTWYEQQRPGLGSEFLDAVDAALREIVGYPLRQPVIFRDLRRLLLKRFPYAVFYRVYPSAIVVVACMHGRRDPLRWKGRHR